jgi:zinc transporter, ZIP family
MLIIIVTIITFLGLTFITKKLTKKSKKEKQSLEQEKHHSSKSISTSLSSTSIGSQLEIIKPITLSMMVAIGIGLRNFGEGLAIGSTILIGEIAKHFFNYRIYNS